MSLTVDQFDVGIFLPAMFPINVQGKPFVLDNHSMICFVLYKNSTDYRDRSRQTEDNNIVFFLLSIFKYKIYIKGSFWGLFFWIVIMPIRHPGKQTGTATKILQRKENPKNLAKIHYLK